MSSIQPLYDRLVVERVEEEALSPGGIAIPASAQEKSMIATIVAVGEGEKGTNGELRPLKVKVGDRVVIGKYSGTELKHDGKDLVIVREDDVLGIIK